MTNTEKAKKSRKVRRSLGLGVGEPLPRCGHKMPEGKKCTRIAGTGTDHLGTGWCWLHEKGHGNKACRDRADACRDAIREGYPNDIVENMKTPKYIEKVEREAEEAQFMIGMRDNQKAIIDIGGELLEAFRTGKRPDGNVFTESGKNGPVQASDLSVAELFRKMTDSHVKNSKTMLEIMDSDYVHIDACKVFFGEIMRIAKQIMSEKDYFDFAKSVQGVKQPKVGRKK